MRIYTPKKQYSIGYYPQEGMTFWEQGNGTEFESYNVDAIRLCHILDCTPSVSLHDFSQGIHMNDQEKYLFTCQILNMIKSENNGGDMLFTFENDKMCYHLTSFDGVFYHVVCNSINNFDVDIYYHRKSVNLANKHKLIAQGTPVLV